MPGPDHPDRRRRPSRRRHPRRPPLLPRHLDTTSGAVPRPRALPAVVYREQSLVAKLLRDLLTDDFATIRIDNPREHRRTLELVERIMPALAAAGEALLQAVSRSSTSTACRARSTRRCAARSGSSRAATSSSTRPRRWWPSTSTPAATSARRPPAGSRTPSSRRTSRRCKEIVRQIRLRDLGGIIVLDFIDMEEKKNRQKVFQAIEQELRRDRAPSKAIQVSDFGLIIVTRKRVKQSLERQLTDQCPYCSGTGTIKSSATICFEILTEMRKLGARPQRSGRAAAGQSGYRARRCRARRPACCGGGADGGQAHRAQARPASPPRTVRRDGAVGAAVSPADTRDRRTSIGRPAGCA